MTGYEFLVSDGYNVMRKAGEEICLERHRHSLWMAVELVEDTPVHAVIQPVLEAGPSSSASSQPAVEPPKARATLRPRLRFERHEE